MIWFAFTGLIILYTDVIHEKFSGSEFTVDAGSSEASLDVQLQTILDQKPGYTFDAVTPGREPSRSNLFNMSDANGGSREVFV
ncbi:MAG: hypothetical protein ACKOCE_05010, partial [Acidimicrobiia bacterium]